MELRYNPASGVGRADRIARRFADALGRSGHTPRLRAATDTTQANQPPDLLVLIGGDGTVKHALDDALALDVPVYHVPLGNENLFARHYAMTRDPSGLIEAIRSWNLDRVDVAVVEGSSRAGLPARSRFAIMLSVGPDASVIHRMESAGRAISGHLAYLAPVAEELDRPAIVPVWASVDGRSVVVGQPGLVVVANFPQYAFSINPAADADPWDGLLDLVFIPARTVGPLFWAGACGVLGRLDLVPGLVRARGRTIHLDAPDGPVQVDGEALLLRGPLTLSLEPATLSVLTPPGSRASTRA